MIQLLPPYLQPKAALGVRKWLAVNPQGEVRNPVGVLQLGRHTSAPSWVLPPLPLPAWLFSCSRSSAVACSQSAALQ